MKKWLIESLLVGNLQVRYLQESEFRVVRAGEQSHSRSSIWLR